MPDEMATTTDKGRLERIASVGHVTVASLSGTVDDDMSGGGRAPRRKPWRDAAPDTLVLVGIRILDRSPG